MLRRVLLAVLTVPLALPATASAAADPVAFGTLIDEVGRTMLARYPEEVTDLGLSAELGLDDTRLNDLSPEYLAESARLAQEGLDRLAAVDIDALAPDERITHAVAGWYLDDIVTMSEYADHEYAVNFITGAHANMPEFMADIHPLDEATDAETYVQRLWAAGDQLRQVSTAVVRNEEAGNLPTKRGLDIASWQIGQLVDAAESHALVGDLRVRLEPLGLDGLEHERIVGEAQDSVRGSIVPAASELARVVAGAEVRADTQPGVLHHPGGDDYYAAALRHHLTTSLTPTDVHEIGLAEIERVRAELTDALGAAGIDVAGLGFARAIGAASGGMPVVPLRSDEDRSELLQRAATFTGYAEGWALYAERLAYEAGLYEDDPLGNIGRLRMDLLRAARAVADTGIHALGWSRFEAIAYLVEQGLPEGWAASEVDRYIVWPGQAPAYLIGMLEILRLRDEAGATLGDDFEVAAFHDAVLRHGSVPLEVLPMAVDAYVEANQAG